MSSVAQDLGRSQLRLRRDGAALDVSELPSYGFGHRSILWWATACMMAIEGTVFALAIVSYFYLRTHSATWPMSSRPPALTFGTLNTVILLLSLAPNEWAKRAAERHDLRGVRIALVLCMLFALAFLAVRWLEFGALHCRWDENAYGSIVWTLMGLHTLHLVTDTYDSGVVTALTFVETMDGKRFVDVSENAVYWYFVVLSWLPIYVVVYWAPRFV
jgi:heme/copper-type cytochrome/quinol oxidase subunit 3